MYQTRPSAYMGLEGLRALLWDRAIAWLADYDATSESERPRLVQPKRLTDEDKRAARAKARAKGGI
jgi:hypothetical protein